MPAKGQPVIADFPVVCLCGSAGAFQVYQDIIEKLPVHTGMAFIVVAHRADSSPARLPWLLGRMTEMEVLTVSDGMKLAPNCIFVGPPHRQMTAEKSLFRLQTYSRSRSWPVLISVFLESLAEECGPRSIAIILSGMGHDGSSALHSIKEGGGRTFAQSDAQFDSMPNRARATGFVDFWLPASRIGESVAKLARASQPISCFSFCTPRK